MKTAIVHDWIYSISGAEKVLESINALFPSTIYTLVKNKRSKLDSNLPIKDIKTSFLQYMPFAKEKYPYYLPLFPFAVETFKLRDFDIIISSSSCAAKGVKKHSGQIHICYCHTPMRFLWDLHNDYLKIYNYETGIKRYLVTKLFSKLKTWDIKTSQGVDFFIANSNHTAQRIRKAYNRESTVIYPPVDVEFYNTSSDVKEDYYVTAARFVPYKKINLVIETFNQLSDRKLLILGQGPEKKALEALVKSKNIQIKGYVSKLELKTMIAKAKAFIYMAHEDFGILPVEAQACGTPIIAYGRGGVLETTKQDVTAILFEAQTSESLKAAILEFEQKQKLFNTKDIKNFSKNFSSDKFNHKFDTFVRSICKKHMLKGKR